MSTKDIPYLDRLKEELMRSIDTQHQEGPAGAPPARPRRGLRMALAGGAAAALVAAGVTAAVVLGGGTPAPGPTTPPVGTTQPPGGSLGQCEPGGTAEAIGEREYGLSGTIVDVTVPDDDSAPTEVTVEVDHWYRTGDFGDAATVVVRTYTRPSGPGQPVSLVGGEVPLEVGARILATGDDDFLWDCGDFSRPWSEDGAALFAEAFGG